MLYCDRTDISKGIDLAKSNNIKKHMICNYWFYNHGFKFRIVFVMVTMILRYFVFM